MYPSFMVEEYDGKFWVHEPRIWDPITDTYSKGKLMRKKPFKTYDKAQSYATKLEIRGKGL